jgi:hypothetical protein
LNPRGLVDIMKRMRTFGSKPLCGGDHMTLIRRREIDTPPDKGGIGHDKMAKLLEQQKGSNIRGLL